MAQDKDDLKIVLAFHGDEISRQYPTGYWQATAQRFGDIEFDGDGTDPLNAMTELARQLYEAVPHD